METIRFVAFSFSALQAGTAVISITEARVTLSTVDHTEPVSITAFLRNTHNAECAITSCFLLLSPRRRCRGRQPHAPEKGIMGQVHAAAAARGTIIENGRWRSKARSRWPTIVYFGLWVGGIIPAISLRKWW